MWIRREATTRRPASSSILVTAPVRLRRVASGLMIEKVRSVAIAERLHGLSRWKGARPYPLAEPFASRQQESVENTGYCVARLRTLAPTPLLVALPEAPIDP